MTREISRLLQAKQISEHQLEKGIWQRLPTNRLACSVRICFPLHHKLNLAKATLSNEFPELIILEHLANAVMCWIHYVRCKLRAQECSCNREIIQPVRMSST